MRNNRSRGKVHTGTGCRIWTCEGWKRRNHKYIWASCFVKLDSWGLQTHWMKAWISVNTLYYSWGHHLLCGQWQWCPGKFCKSSSLIWHVTRRQGVAPRPELTFLLSIIFLLVYLRTVINDQCAWCPMESSVSCLAVQINFHWNYIMNLGLKKDSGQKESGKKKASLCT